MPQIAGMSIGSWILLAVIIAWAVIAIKVYFFGGFKKKGGKSKVGSCCDTGDDDFTVSFSACSGCSKRNGCASAATFRNAAVPTIKPQK